MKTIIRASFLALIAASHAHSREFTLADNGQDRKKRDSLEGLTARISANGRLVWVHESSAGLLTGKTLTFGSVTITTSGSKGNPPYSGPPDGLASALLR